MPSLLYLLCNLLLLQNLQLQAKSSTPSDAFYIAGVVEFPLWTVDLNNEERENRLMEFRELLKSSISAAIQPDIVVFPEHVLNNHTTAVRVPSPHMGILACGNNQDHYDVIITEVSCMARDFQMYLLINLAEIEAETEQDLQQCDARQDSFIHKCEIYSTNVVFDRSGRIVSRYRKYNRIHDEWLIYDYTPQEVEQVFSTDFNVRFGHFASLDLMYYEPAQALVNRGITDFLYPNNLPSMLPFMTAMQLHQSWAYANNVNLMVASANNPQQGFTGTGIYIGHFGTLNATMTTNANKRQIFYSIVPKKSIFYGLMPAKNVLEKVTSLSDQQFIYLQRITGINLLRDNDIDLYSSIPLEEGSTYQVHEVCHNDLCCKFDITMRKLTDTIASFTTSPASFSTYAYRLAAYKGKSTFLNRKSNEIALCALLACTGTKLSDCGYIYPAEILVQQHLLFESLKISGNFSQDTALILPSSVDGMLAPLPVSQFDFEIVAPLNGGMAEVNFELLQPRADLLTFGIYAKYLLDMPQEEQVMTNNQSDQESRSQMFTRFLFYYCTLYLEWLSIYKSNKFMLITKIFDNNNNKWEMKQSTG